MRRSLLLSAAALAATLALAACGSLFGQQVTARPRPVFSPNGEVLSRGGREAPSCAEALGGWWDRLAASHGGSVDKAAFLADAELQFQTMDLDHDGFITPAELSEYRAGADQQMDEIVLPPDAVNGTESAPPPMSRGRGRRGGPTSDSAMASNARTAISIPPDMVDPVMSADKSLSFKVSHQDFMTQAVELFDELDKAHSGRISRETVLATCPKQR